MTNLSLLPKNIAVNVIHLVRIRVNRLIAFCIFTMLILCLAACHSKLTPIDKLEELAEDVRQNASDYTEEDWQYTAEELELIESEIEQYKNEYTDEELKEIGRLKGIYLAQLTKYSLKSFKNGLENAIKEAEGVIEGLQQGFEDTEE